jgi:hypothetical protein
MHKEVNIAIRELYYLPGFKLLFYYEEEVIDERRRRNRNSSIAADESRSERRTFVSYIDLKKVTRHFKENRFEITLDVQLDSKNSPYQDLRNKPVIRLTPQRDYLIIRTDSTYITLMRTADLENNSLESMMSNSSNNIEFKAEANESNMIITDFTLIKINTSMIDKETKKENEPQQPCDLFVSFISCSIGTAVRDIENDEGPSDSEFILSTALVRCDYKFKERFHLEKDKRNQHLKLGVDYPTIGDIGLVYVKNLPLLCFIMHDYAISIKEKPVKLFATYNRLIFVGIDLKTNSEGDTVFDLTRDADFSSGIFPLQGLPSTPTKEQTQDKYANGLLKEKGPNQLSSSLIVTFQSTISYTSENKPNPLYFLIISRGGIEKIHFVKIPPASYTFMRMVSYSKLEDSIPIYTSSIETLCRELHKHRGTNKKETKKHHMDLKYSLALNNIYSAQNTSGYTVSIVDQEKRTAFAYKKIRW